MHDATTAATTRSIATNAGARRVPPSASKLASFLGACALGVAAFCPMQARAVDGCLVLLCFAAPSWSAIPQCVPPIHQVLSDLARGRPFPTCSMSGAGNTATHRWSNAPDFCPPQYSHADALESGYRYSCDYAGAVEVDIDGALWTRTWWSMGAGTVTEYAPAAKAQFGSWATRFDDDYSAWLSSLPTLPTCATC